MVSSSAAPESSNLYSSPDRSISSAPAMNAHLRRRTAALQAATLRIARSILSTPSSDAPSVAAFTTPATATSSTSSQPTYPNTTRAFPRHACSRTLPSACRAAALSSSTFIITPPAAATAAAMSHPQPHPLHASALGDDTHPRPTTILESTNSSNLHASTPDLSNRTTTTTTTSMTTTSSLSPPEQKPTATPMQPSSRIVTWGYLPENGPDQWATLSEDYVACANLGTQSPIALSYRESVVVDDDENNNGNRTSASRPTLTLRPGRFHLRRREAQPGAQFKSLMFDVYMPQSSPLVKDGPSVDVHRPLSNPATLTFSDGAAYILNGFHLHAPFSEHSIDGNRGVLELHFVFQQRRRTKPSGVARAANASPLDTQTAPAATDSSNGNADFPLQAQAPPTGDIRMAVVGVIFDEAKESSPWLRTVLDIAVPRDVAVDTFPEAGKVFDLDLSGILPNLDASDVYEYTGSLTTPPGTEGIRWLLLGKRACASADDVALLRDSQNGPNVRPVQPLGSRRVLFYPAKSSPKISS